MLNLWRTFRVINGMVEAGIIEKYAISGAIAAMYYLEPTITTDLDVLVSTEDLENRKSGIATLDPLVSHLRNLGYTEFKQEGIVIEGWPVQFLPVASPLDAEGLDQAVDVEIQIEDESDSEPIKVRMLSAEHIVATPLKVGRPKDRERVLRFVEEKAVDLSTLRGVLERHDLLVVWEKLRDKMGLPDLNETP